MAQLLVRPEQIADNRFRVDGPQAHHLVRVLRARPGQLLTLSDGAGRRFSARLTAVDTAAPSAEGDILAAIPASAPRRRFRLLQGLPKGPKIDYVIEKAVELGAAEIVPFLSEKSLIRLDEKSAAAKQDRWSRLAEAAAKQCERADVPSVAAAIPFAELAAIVASSPTFLLSIAAGRPSLAEALEDSALFDGDSDIISIVVGPESGLSAAEETALAHAGARAVSLGDRVLRTETAGLAALAILDFHFNQRKTNR